MSRKRRSLDVETHLTQPGLAAPPLVAVATAAEEPGTERLYVGPEARAVARELITDPDVDLENTFISYDLAVLAADDPSLLPAIFKALDEGRVYDTTLLEALHDNARGLMFREANGAPFNRYSQALLEARYLNVDRTEEKYGPDAWRTRYHELDGVPLEEWPEAAVEYPRRDARHALDIATVQRFGADRQNLPCHADEVRFAFAAMLQHVWGIRTDPLLVKKVVAEIEHKHHESRMRFLRTGIVRFRPVQKDEEPEALDEGFMSAVEDMLQELTDPSAGEDQGWLTRRGEDLVKARRALQRGKGLRFAVDTARLKELVTAAYLGTPPVTDTCQVSTSRDTLHESDDPVLEEYADAGENEKLFSTYRAVLVQGTEVPINAEVNTLVETQRTSMRRPNLQQLPKKGLIRECFIARGYEYTGDPPTLEPGEDPWVFLTSDWTAFEMSTLAQCCINLGLESEMAKAINRDEDLHIKLAAKVAGLEYAEALALKKNDDPSMLNLRRAMKPVNFGLGGLMGPPKLVFTARKGDESESVRFCELAGVSKSCAENRRTTQWGRRTITPTCVECLELADTYKKAWYEVFPEMVEYHRITVRASDTGGIRSFGTGMFRANDSANACSNHLFQNLAAQIAKKAAYEVARDAYANPRSPLFNNYRTAVLVHDELFGECREAFLHDAMLRQTEIMTDVSRRYLTHVKVGIEPAACRRWFKSAKPVFDRYGHLRPWWPEKWSFEPDARLKAADLEAVKR